MSSPGFLFCSLNYHYLFWYSDCPRFDQWESLLIYPCHSLGNFLLASTRKCSQVVLFFPCLNHGMGCLSREPWFLWVENRKLTASLFMDRDTKGITYQWAHTGHTCTWHVLTDTCDSHPGFFQTLALASFSDIHWLTPSPWPFLAISVHWYPPGVNPKLYSGYPTLFLLCLPRHCQAPFSPLQSAQWYFAWERGREEWHVFKVEFDSFILPLRFVSLFLNECFKGEPLH